MDARRAAPWGRGERGKPGSSSRCTAARDERGETVAGYQPRSWSKTYSGTASGKQRSLRIPQIAEADIEALEGQGGALVTVENHPFTAVPGHPAVVSTSNKLKITDHGISLGISGCALS